MCAGRVGGFVLAGGRSSRMGTDKALLRLHGKTLLQSCAEAVERAVGSAVIVGDPLRHDEFGYPVISDQVCDSGPLAGIHAALTHSTAAWNLIVACDMPRLAVSGLADLVAQATTCAEADVVIPYLDGRGQPLCALYHRRALAVIESALQLRCLKIMDAIAPLYVVRLDAVDADLFRNVNTPEEWSALLAS